MKEKEATIEDIKVIRRMMEDSSKFLSLSGLSGVAAGFVAVIGAVIAYWFVLDGGGNTYDEYMKGLKHTNTNQVRLGLIVVAAVVFIVAVSLAYFFSWRKSRKSELPFWTASTRKVAWNLCFVLFIGGVFSLILMYHENIRLVASVMLIFYGMALLMAAKYTLRDIQYLGYTEIGLGLLAGVFLNYGLVFWTLGFGVFHIVYGVSMYLKYDR